MIFYDYQLWHKAIFVIEPKAVSGLNKEQAKVVTRKILDSLNKSEKTMGKRMEVLASEVKLGRKDESVAIAEVRD